MMSVMRVILSHHASLSHRALQRKIISNVEEILFRECFQVEQETLNEQLRAQKTEAESKREMLEQQVNELRARLRQTQTERESEQDDHGAVLNEMQTRFAKERTKCEQMERQVIAASSFHHYYIFLNFNKPISCSILWFIRRAK